MKELSEHVNSLQQCQSKVQPHSCMHTQCKETDQGNQHDFTFVTLSNQTWRVVEPSGYTALCSFVPGVACFKSCHAWCIARPV